MRNNLVKDLEDLLACWKLCNDEDSPINQEINMWRNSFLETCLEQEKYSEEEIIKIKSYFMAIPSENFMQKIPEEQFFSIKKYIKT